MPVTTIYSTPMSFSVGILAGGGSKVCMFSIPSNLVSINSATWYSVQDTPNGVPSVTVSSNNLALVNTGGNNFSVALNSTHLNAIIAAVGGNLTATYGIGSYPQLTVNPFYLYLDYVASGSSGGGGGSGGDSGLPQPAPGGGLYLQDGSYISGSTVCEAGAADKLALQTWIRQGHV